MGSGNPGEPGWPAREKAETLAKPRPGSRGHARARAEGLYGPGCRFSCPVFLAWWCVRTPDKVQCKQNEQFRVSPR